MSLLDDEIAVARKEIVSDGYDMSIGELINLYKDEEIRIHPEFQRLFRWDLTRKTRFIESILLGLPLPPIFVYQDTDGIWELIDGLQRLSTIFEFVGVLRGSDGVLCASTELEGTRTLPSLNGKKWNSTFEDIPNGIGSHQQLQIKRARIRVEILKQESDPQSKYELFQRLNSGGESLSEQEMRNCIGVMLNPSLQRCLVELSEFHDFRKAINQTEYAIERQVQIELVLRFFAFRHVSYKSGLDIHDYLNDALFKIATDCDFNLPREKEIFFKTFKLIFSSMGGNAFTRWNGSEFGGKFLMSVYEVVAYGVAFNIDSISELDESAAEEFVRSKSISLWKNEIFLRYSGSGVRGTSRLPNLLPLAQTFFRP